MSLSYSGRDETIRTALERTVATIQGPRVTLRDLLLILGDHGPLLLCAVLTVPFLLPVSIPGVSTVFGLAIFLLGFAITLNRTPWLPAWIMDRQLDAAKLQSVLRRGIGLVSRIEKVIGQRIGILTRGALAGRINGLAIVAGAGLLMLPLGLVPFSNTLPAFAILFLCIGMSQRDGLVLIAGYGMLVATVLYFSVLAAAALAAGRGLASMIGG